MITDPIADMLTRIRNASTAGLSYVTIPASQLKIQIAQILEDEGFVKGFRLVRNEQQGKIKIALKYNKQGLPLIKGIVRASRPGRRIYTKTDDIPKVRNGLGISILSTPKGVIPGHVAKEERVGGELLAFVW